jgi:hypothetical protein
VSELSGRELLNEWRQVMDSVVTSVAGRADLPRELLGAMQRQLELMQEVIERERGLQGELASRLLAPVDAAFDLLEETGATLRRQAEALEAAGRALEETAGLMKGQAELFERTVVTLRRPATLAKEVIGARQPPKKRATRQPRD